MLFNSYIFIAVFLPVTLAGFFFLGGRGNPRGAALWLTTASFFFYGWWNPRYLALLAISILVNYGIGLGIQNARRGRIKIPPKTLLSVGVILNLGALGYFKYANFFIDNCRHFLGLQWPMAEILLPLAISFFTFTQIAYLVDVYHGVTEEHDFLYYCFFVSFFPHLIAGPIVSYRHLMPQFARAETYRFQAENMAPGLSLFVLGLAKKVLIADGLSLPAQTLFDTPNLSPGLITSWVGALAFTFQLYFDFSAYSDMAIGLACMFNVRFPLNFNSPYKALDISDFWRRWHMTLSHFLRDHLYIPLGGNRQGEARRYLNLMITMLLGGLWHGAGWTFVVWGGLHGTYLVIHHSWQKQAKNLAWAQGWIPTAAGWAVTFLAVVVGWVFFRAHSFAQAASILQGMAGGHGIGMPANFAPPQTEAGTHGPVVAAAPQLHGQQILYLAIAAAIAFFAPNTDEIFRIAERYTDQSRSAAEGRWWGPTPFWALATGALLTVCALNLSNVSEFLYFKF